MNQIDSVEDGKVYYFKDMKPELVDDGYDWTLRSEDKIKDCVKYYYFLDDKKVNFKRVIFHLVNEDILLVHYFGAKHLPKPTKSKPKILLKIKEDKSEI